MKLNKKGWGTVEMLLLSSGLFIALLIATFLISKLYGSMESATKNKYYVDLETKLESAAIKYVTENHITSDSVQYVITSNKLKNNNYLDELNDMNGNICEGYVVVTDVSGINDYKAYISCNNYKTLNY